MYFDFEDQHPDIDPIESAFSLSTGVLFSLVFHVLIALTIAFAPELLLSRETKVLPAVEMQAEPKREPVRFVFMQPRVDTLSKRPPPKALPSDANRTARSVEKPPTPENAQPFMRGNTPERVEQTPEQSLARGRGNTPEPDELQASAPVAPNPAPSSPQPETQIASIAPPANRPSYTPPSSGGRPGGGSLGDSLRNLDRYVQGSQFDNQQGGAPAQSAIQFDSKGVDFGPWLRRFKVKVERNWIIPQAALINRGRVVLQFIVHRDGRISDLRIVQAATVNALTTSAVNAIQMSNPTLPLPDEYPADFVLFTVTFHYNDR